jgi:competence protein ComFC
MLNEFCLYCHGEIVKKVSWSSFFTKDEEKYLCSVCEKRLVVIKGETCELCDRPLAHLESQYIRDNRCYDCIRWEEDLEWAGYLNKNTSIYVYNNFLKDIISQFKFRGDYELVKAFSKPLREKVGSFDYLVPIPLSTERQFERGFNQSEALIREAGLRPTQILQRKHSDKQSKKSRNERIHIEQVFQLIENTNFTGKTILLIDDIYTTGSTLRQAAKILIKAGAKSVSSLTLARG